MLKFDSLEPIIEPVQIGETSYLAIMEAKGTVSAAYRNMLLDSTELDSEGKPRASKSLADIEMFLVSQCTYRLTEEAIKRLLQNPDRDLTLPDLQASIPLEEVGNWRDSVIKNLYKRIIDISELRQQPSSPTQPDVPIPMTAGSN